MTIKRGDNIRLLVEQPNMEYRAGGCSVTTWQGEDIEILATLPVGTIGEVEYIDDEGDYCNIVVHNNSDPLDSTIGTACLRRGEYEVAGA